MKNKINLQEIKIGVVGLGYVGLPLAIAFSSKFETIGFDINNNRICNLKSGIDNTCEVDQEEINNAIDIKFTNDILDIEDCNFYIITVPTPIDVVKRPDLSALISASEAIGKILNKNDYVVYESTVYPGATEEICIPILENASGLKINKDFYCGYSPERINPGDKNLRIKDIRKITSGSNVSALENIDNVYKHIITAGTYQAQSIKVAEAAKVIENTQRDLNIALINELAIIFNKLDIDTHSVLNAAKTKWNFLDFKPGLVGGHCIGVDPYYLTHKSQEVGYSPEIILSGRKLNDNMSKYVANQIIKKLIKKSTIINSSKILVLGLTFKENCPDLRNSKVFDLIDELVEYGCAVEAYDPWITINDIKKECNFKLIEKLKPLFYDAVIVAVGHDQFKEMTCDKVKTMIKSNGLIYDIKNTFENELDVERL